MRCDGVHGPQPRAQTTRQGENVIDIRIGPVAVRRQSVGLRLLPARPLWLTELDIHLGTHDPGLLAGARVVQERPQPVQHGLPLLPEEGQAGEVQRGTMIAGRTLQGGIQLGLRLVEPAVLQQRLRQAQAGFERLVMTHLHRLFQQHNPGVRIASEQRHTSQVRPPGFARVELCGYLEGLVGQGLEAVGQVHHAQPAPRMRIGRLVQHLLPGFLDEGDDLGIHAGEVRKRGLGKTLPRPPSETKKNGEGHGSRRATHNEPAAPAARDGGRGEGLSFLSHGRTFRPVPRSRRSARLTAVPGKTSDCPSGQSTRTSSTRSTGPRPK